MNCFPASIVGHIDRVTCNDTSSRWHATTQRSGDLQRHSDRVTYSDTVIGWPATTQWSGDLKRHSNWVICNDTVVGWPATTQRFGDLQRHRDRVTCNNKLIQLTDTNSCNDTIKAMTAIVAVKISARERTLRLCGNLSWVRALVKTYPAFSGITVIALRDQEQQ